MVFINIRLRMLVDPHMDYKLELVTEMEVVASPVKMEMVILAPLVKITSGKAHTDFQSYQINYNSLHLVQYTYVSLCAHLIIIKAHKGYQS